MSSPTKADVSEMDMTNIPRKIRVGPSAALKRMSIEKENAFAEVGRFVTPSDWSGERPATRLGELWRESTARARIYAGEAENAL